MPNKLDRDILQTIVYFDIFSYPLTTLEIWKNMDTQLRYGEIVRALDRSDWLKARVEFEDGRWRLRAPTGNGAAQSNGEQARRYRAAKHKLDEARRFVRFARRIPGVEAIYACNSLGFVQARPESDIDLFVTVLRGRIWSVRFFAVTIAKFFFRRPADAHSKDAICLSFFAAEDADMRRAALGDGDVYYEHWLKNLLPLWQSGRAASGGGKPFSRGACAIVEKTLRAIQLRLMPEGLKELANGGGTAVILNDEFLKFHNNDRREYFSREYEKRLARVAG